MKYIAIAVLLLFALALNAQGMTLEEWNRQAETNIRLLPKYGNAEKTAEQKKSDKTFIADVMAKPEFKNDRSLASAHMIGLGFNYLHKGDIKTAMYRFNQAWLLDPKNTDTSWGFGVIYMVLGDEERGLQQYAEGMKLNPDNTHILTDYATYYLGRYYDNNETKELDKALEYLDKSYKLDSKNQDTLFKLSVIWMLKEDCKKAVDYHYQCKALGGAPITPEYAADLLAKCLPNNKP